MKTLTENTKSRIVNAAKKLDNVVSIEFETHIPKIVFREDNTNYVLPNRIANFFTDLVAFDQRISSNEISRLLDRCVSCVE